MCTLFDYQLVIFKLYIYTSDMEKLITAALIVWFNNWYFHLRFRYFLVVRFYLLNICWRLKYVRNPFTWSSQILLYVLTVSLLYKLHVGIFTEEHGCDSNLKERFTNLKGWGFSDLNQFCVTFFFYGNN